METPRKRLVHLDRYFYNLLRTAEGGFGRVWLLERPDGGDVGTVYGHFRAAKTFNGQDQQLIVDELSHWIMLHHKNILPLIKISRLDFSIAALMEMRNGTLGDTLSRGAIDWTALRTILMQVCDALDYALSERKLLHLDIKPENILIDSFPTSVQVSDWDISRLATERRVSGAISGTLQYIAPERFTKSSPATQAQDIFSIGMVAIVSLTLALPYHVLNDRAQFGTPAEQVRAQLCAGAYMRHAERLLADQPSRVRQLLLKCIDPDPRRRIAEHRELRSALEGMSG